MKILTLNLRYNNDHWDLRKPLVIDLIRGVNADIIGFQEVWMEFQQAHLILDAVSNVMPYDIYVTPKQAHHGTEGIAIATDLPTSQHEVLNLPGGERVAQRLVIDTDGGQICIANTHLHHLPSDDEIERLPQMTALLDWLDEVDMPIVLTGDMNTTPGTDTALLAKSRYVSAYEQVHGKEPDFTFPAPLAEDGYVGEPSMIDYIFISPDSLRATSASLVGAEAHGTNPKLSASDHLGIVATIVHA